LQLLGFIWMSLDRGGNKRSGDVFVAKRLKIISDKGYELGDAHSLELTGGANL
jgi:hypothetical protein